MFCNKLSLPSAVYMWHWGCTCWRQSGLVALLFRPQYLPLEGVCVGALKLNLFVDAFHACT